MGVVGGASIVLLSWVRFPAPPKKHFFLLKKSEN